MRLILASASPRRKSILTDNGIVFECVPASADERSVDINGLLAQEAAVKLAVFKAQSVFAMLGGGREGIQVLGADTVVVASDGELMGKPEDAREAVSMLMRLSGTSHTVITGVAVASLSGTKSCYEESRVTFPAFGRDFAEKYVRDYCPLDKAGAYGIQELNGLIQVGLEGDYNNVVGLSMKCVRELINTED